MTSMPNRTGRKADEISRTSEFAHAIERAGLAVLGALCGLFVAALIAKADIQAINSVGALFATILYGTIGFYLGIDFPLPTARIIGMASVRNGTRSNVVFLKLIGAIGTLLAAMAAMISVFLIIFELGSVHFLSGDHRRRMACRRCPATRRREYGTHAGDGERFFRTERPKQQ